MRTYGIIDSKHFRFLESFTGNWKAIRAEALEILKHREAIPAFQDVSPDQHKIAKGTNWRTFILFGFGKKLERNWVNHASGAKYADQLIGGQQFLEKTGHEWPFKTVALRIVNADTNHGSLNCFLRLCFNFKTHLTTTLDHVFFFPLLFF